MRDQLSPNDFPQCDSRRSSLLRGRFWWVSVRQTREFRKRTGRRAAAQPFAITEFIGTSWGISDISRQHRCCVAHFCRSFRSANGDLRYVVTDDPYSKHLLGPVPVRITLGNFNRGSGVVTLPVTKVHAGAAETASSRTESRATLPEVRAPPIADDEFRQVRAYFFGVLR